MAGESSWGLGGVVRWPPRRHVPCPRGRHQVPWSPGGPFPSRGTQKRLCRFCRGRRVLRWAGRGALPALARVRRQGDTAHLPPGAYPAPHAPLVGMFLPTR